MSGLEALQSVQYVTAKGKRFAVVDADSWEAMIEWLEDVEDHDVLKESLADLKQAGGDRANAGWRSCDEVQTELE
ncbi:MAG: hypothetical protein IAG10_21415 [Planctomycetaceae bacterium]|nr:hypothetical protein [Planctomycetaceae bacterium]